jgi:hypothetical protein
MNCKECGTQLESVPDWVINPPTLCYNCYFWTDLFKHFPNKVVISGKCYHIDPNENSEFKGFGGRKFKIQFLDGTLVETTNLWYNGTIPEHFLGRFPDNAKFVE